MLFFPGYFTKPCLVTFNTDAPIKSNEMVLVEFSCNFMFGEADLLKHLRLESTSTREIQTVHARFSLLASLAAC